MHGERKSSEKVLKTFSGTRKNLVGVPCPDVEFAFGWNRFNLRLIGLWPDQTCEQGRVSLITRYGPPFFGALVFGFTVAPQALAPIAYSFILDELIQLVAGVAGLSGAIVKILVLWNNGTGTESQLIE